MLDRCKKIVYNVHVSDHGPAGEPLIPRQKERDIMYQIKHLTFDVADMKEAARKHLESCMAYITAYKQSNKDYELKYAAVDFGKAMVWLDMLEDIGIAFNSEDEHIETMLEIASENGLE